MVSPDPFRDRTERSDGAYPDPWPKPDPGDYIIGEVTHIELSAGQYEQPVLAIMCEDNEKEFSVWLPKYLRHDIVDKKLVPGERVSVKYFGLKKGKANEYQHYQLLIDPRSRIATPEAQDAAHERAFGQGEQPEPAPTGGYKSDDDLPF